MQHKMFSVFDSKVNAYMAPFFMGSAGHAIRAFESTVNDPNTAFCKYPADFTLFEIGSFDETTGVISMHDAKLNLGTALQFKNRPTDVAPLFDVAKGAN